MYAVKTDEEGNISVLRLLKDDGTPFIVQTKEQLTSEDKAAQRELDDAKAKARNITDIKIAEIGAQTKIKVATIGAETRLKLSADSLAQNQQQFNEYLKLKKDALNNGNIKAANEYDAKIKNMKLKADTENLLDEDYLDIFGEPRKK